MNSLIYYFIMLVIVLLLTVTLNLFGLTYGDVLFWIINIPIAFLWAIFGAPWVMNKIEKFIK